jgi:hypothetical protein
MAIVVTSSKLIVYYISRLPYDVNKFALILMYTICISLLKSIFTTISIFNANTMYYIPTQLQRVISSTITKSNSIFDIEVMN